MIKRPEWEKCVLTGKYDIPEGEPGGPRKERLTWCGSTPAVGEFCFEDASHAALNGAAKGGLVACTFCVRRIVEALQ